MEDRRTIIIDPVTRIEGHSKITLHLDDQGRGGRRPFSRYAVSRLREVLRGPSVLRDAIADGAHLRHLSGEPPDCLGKGLRRSTGGENSAHCGQIAPPLWNGPGSAIARS